MPKIIEQTPTTRFERFCLYFIKIQYVENTNLNIGMFYKMFKGKRFIINYVRPTFRGVNFGIQLDPTKKVEPIAID